MMDWDNIRFFLHVARQGSIRAAARILNVNHTTIARRIKHLEDQLGVRLFEKLPSGYQITPAGEEILTIAEGMEIQALELERKIYGRDTRLTGNLRITLPQVLATGLLMPDLARFSKTYPGISLEIITSYEALNLTKRQADVAIRLAYKSPPENLYGRKLSTLHRAVYISSALLKTFDFEKPLHWITKEDENIVPAWALKLPLKTHKNNLIVSDPISQLEATREGLGVSVNFCFLADKDPKLSRLPPGDTHSYGDLWILTHDDLRHTPRVQAFMRFLSDAIIAKRPILQGRLDENEARN